MNPIEADKEIRRIFRVKQRDTLPFTGWLKSTRKNIAELYNTFGYKLGAEIGVQFGHHAKMMMDVVEGLELICVDPWSAYNRRSQEKSERIYAKFQKKLKGYNVKPMRMTSMEAAPLIEDQSLDFVYIDGLHEFDSVMRDIIYWARKVKFGGIVAGHDYFAFYQGGVVPAVNAYTRAHNINDWYLTTADQYPSWFWVNKKEYHQGISF
jgi:hypothetical protein